MPDVCDTAPDFTLPRDGGGDLTLSSLRPGKAVLFFYPRDDTSGCTKEAIAFTGMTDAFAKAGVTVLGISKDTVASHDKFRDKHELGVALLSDAERGCVRTIRRLERKEHVRQEIHGDRTLDLFDRRRWQDRAGLAQGQSARPRRGRSGGRTGTMSGKTLSQMAVEVLTTADGRAKTALSREHAQTWFAARQAGDDIPIGNATPPMRPARPVKPELLDPRDVPRRRPGSEKGRIAILHAVAHIELNAVDLALGHHRAVCGCENAHWLFR